MFGVWKYNKQLCLNSLGCGRRKVGFEGGLLLKKIPYIRGMEKETKQKVLNQIYNNVKSDFNKTHEFVYDSSEVSIFEYLRIIPEIANLGYIESYDHAIRTELNIGMVNIVTIKVNKFFKGFYEGGGFLR